MFDLRQAAATQRQLLDEFEKRFGADCADPRRADFFAAVFRYDFTLAGEILLSMGGED